MSDLHDLCKFQSRPVTRQYVENLKFYLKNGIPSTYTIEEAYNFNNGIEDEPSTFTTPLHLIATHLPVDYNEDEMLIIDEMVTILLEYGAGWCLTDINNDTPGCILIRRKLNNTPIYNQIVDAGVRAELLLRKVSEFDVEFIEEEEEEEHDQTTTEDKVIEEDTKQVKEEEQEKNQEQEKENLEKEGGQKSIFDNVDETINDPSFNQEAYLKTKLEYKDNALITKDRKDGVMMSWETELMELGCSTLFDKGSTIEAEEIDSEINILNIGFGMGIIDSMINAKNPTKHYICEAHPDVLNKLRQDGWYEKSNVVILEGRWQDKLNVLLSKGDTFFNGIYYDTYSEHYSDMLDLFDFVVGLLKPHGVFSFFNGLGADRQVIYEVYKKLVDYDLSNYGLNCKFIEVGVPDSTLEEESNDKIDENDDGNENKSKSVWDDVKRSYWSCPVYYHPEIKFIEY